METLLTPPRAEPQSLKVSTAPPSLVEPGSRPSVSVIVCTRDRADQLEMALQAILGSDFRAFELVVVDQSRDDTARLLVQAIGEADARVRYARDDGRGLSHARNVGVRATDGDLIVFTDDDCTPETDWLGRIVNELRGDPGAGIAFGSVVPVPTDAAEGFIVGYIPPRRQRLVGASAKRLDGGIGANMAIRREVLERIGLFDELLGAGGYFPSCEDGDMAYRVLAAGYALLHLPEARVLHYGLRDWKSGSALTRRTYMAVAAAYTKHARLGSPIGAFLVLQQVWLASVNVVSSVIHARRPVGVGRLLALFVGVGRSFELRVDAQHAVYQRRG